MPLASSAFSASFCDALAAVSSAAFASWVFFSAAARSSAALASAAFFASSVSALAALSSAASARLSAASACAPAAVDLAAAAFSAAASLTSPVFAATVSLTSAALFFTGAGSTGSLSPDFSFHTIAATTAATTAKTIEPVAMRPDFARRASLPDSLSAVCWTFFSRSLRVAAACLAASLRAFFASRRALQPFFSAFLRSLATFLADCFRFLAPVFLMSATPSVALSRRVSTSAATSSPKVCS